MTKNNIKATQGYLQIGMIVGQVNIVETSINWIIAEYYTGCDDDSEINLRFQTDILNSGMIRLDDKLKLLKRVAETKGVHYPEGMQDDLNRWKIIRNTVAHGVPHHGSDGSIAILLNGTLHDIDRLRKGFGERQDRITTFLSDLLPEKNKLVN